MKLSTQHMHTLAWLGLLAMLMVFIAPSISAQLTENNNKKNKSMPIHGHQMMSHHQLAEASPSMHRNTDMMDESDFDLCGYCSLFHHFPPLDTAILTLPGTEIQPAKIVINHGFGIVATDLFLPYQTRAPPEKYHLNYHY